MFLIILSYLFRFPFEFFDVSGISYSSSISFHSISIIMATPISFLLWFIRSRLLHICPFFVMYEYHRPFPLFHTSTFPLPSLVSRACYKTPSFSALSFFLFLFLFFFIPFYPLPYFLFSIARHLGSLIYTHPFSSPNLLMPTMVLLHFCLDFKLSFDFLKSFNITLLSTSRCQNDKTELYNYGCAYGSSSFVSSLFHKRPYSKSCVLSRSS